LASLLAAAPIPSELVIDAFRVLHQLEPGQARRRAQLAQHECDRLSLSEIVEERTGSRSVHALVARTIRFSDRASERTELFKVLAVGVMTKALIESGVGQQLPELLASSLPGMAGPIEPSELGRELVEEAVKARAARGRPNFEDVGDTRT
jgi:hypothetical protein